MTKRVAKTSVFLMMLVLSIVPIVSVAGMCDPIVPIPELCDVTITLPDEELGTIFAQDYAAGGASLVATTDIPGPGVQFDFSGLTTLWTSKVGVSDNYGRGGIDKLAGGSIDAWGRYGDFSMFTQYRLLVTNIGPDPIYVKPIMNTGFGASPNLYDTFWTSSPVLLGVGESKVATLDFSSTEAWNVADDPVPEWQYADGTTGLIVRRLDEVSNIGFEVTGGGGGGASIVVSAVTPSVTLTLSDYELATHFAYEYGPGTVTAITDIPGSVRFDFTGLNLSVGTLVGDDFPVDQSACGAWKDYGSGFAGPYDFSAYDRYSMIFTNVGVKPVTVSLLMNTGWTGSPWGTPQRDTFWQSAWTSVSVGDTVTVTLDFSGAIVYNAEDDPNLAWQYTDGTIHPVHRLDEVSNIGFQILGNNTGSIVITHIVDFTLSLHDDELSTQFAYEYGPGTVTAITDIVGPGVKFDFSGLSASVGTVVGDDFPVSSLADGDWKDYGSGFAGYYDFSKYTRYALAFTNVGTSTVTVNLKMNTGWTDSPWGTSQKDTFWQNTWTTLAPNETRTVWLDFWSAEVYNAGDDPVTAWQYSDGTAGVIVRRLDEVSNIGFQILGSGGASVIITNIFDTCLTLSDWELATQFGKETGPGDVTITDIACPGVQFDFTGLSLSVGTVVGDNFPVHSAAGGAYKTYGVTSPFSTWGDFTAYTKYVATITHVGGSPVTVNLKMNTGWTIPPPEYAAMWRDTFWQNTWTYIGVGQTKTITLDFSSAEVYNAGDEVEFVTHSDGTAGVAVWRLDEVSNIGFQVLGDGAASIVVSGIAPIGPPTANFTWAPGVPEVGETVTFNGSSSTPNGGAITSWIWEFDDGEYDTGEIVTHDFDAAGTYDVTLHVSDSECLGSDITKTVTVETGEEPEPESQGTLKVEPENYTAVHNNETFDVNVTVHDLNASARVIGIEFKLGYNTTLLEVLNVTEGPFMEAFAGEPHQGTLFMSWKISDYVLVDVLIFADENGTWHEPFPNGNGTLATITFRAIYQPLGVEKPCAACNLTLYDTKMGDPEANPIPHDSIDGYYEIVPTVIGDINYDGIVDIFDAIAFANCFGTRPGHPRWCPQADLNGDDLVDIFDAIIMSSHFGEVAPTSCP